MAIISRPLKPIGGGGGADWTADSFLDADEFNTEFDTIYDDYNGNITNANVSASAAIDGSKLANTSIATTKLIDKSVTDAKLANDAAVDASRAVGVNHIKDDSIIARSLKVTQWGQAPVKVIVGGTAYDMATGLLSFEVIPVALMATFAGPPPGGTIEQLVLTLWADTNDNQYYVRVYNAGSLSVSLTANVYFSLVYVPAS